MKRARVVFENQISYNASVTILLRYLSAIAKEGSIELRIPAVDYHDKPKNVKILLVDIRIEAYDG